MNRSQLFITTATATLSAMLGMSALALDKQDLRVLYTGDPASERMEDFTTFLDQHFVEVGSTSYESFTADMADHYDVVIFDWPTIYPRQENGAINTDGNFTLNTPTMPVLPADWDRPSILIGSAGQRVAGQFRSKFDWL